MTSIDIAGSDYENGGYFPVQIYDGSTIPYPDSTFDFVFSCNVLEHVAQRDKLLAEIRRVLKPGGLFVHETRVSQMLAHPVRSFGRSIPWDVIPNVVPERWAGLWTARRKS